MSGNKDNTRTVALLFGRGGSVGLPGKNMKAILGRPSLHYPLLAARASGLVDELYLSTDSDEIRSLATPFGVRNIERPPELANNQALLEDAMVHAYGVVETAESRPVDFYLLLLCNSVTVTPERIRTAHRMLRETPDADSVTTGAKWNMFSPVRARRMEAGNGRLRNYIPLEALAEYTTISCDRDKAENCFFCDNSFTLVRREALGRLHDNEGPFGWMGNEILLLEQEPGGGDIDHPWQVPVVEWWLRQQGYTETTLPFDVTGVPA